MHGHGRTSIGAASLLAVVAASGAPEAVGELGTRGRTQFAMVQGIGPIEGRHRASVSVSLDGRFIAFESRARLAPDDTNDVSDIYVLDRLASIVTLESVGSGGMAANRASHAPQLSGDGRYLVFESSATNLGARSGSRDWVDIFLRDRRARTTERLSIGIAGDEPNGPSRDPAISADGRWIAFTSQATNLVAGEDTNDSGSDVYLFSADTRQLRRASVSSAGVQPALGESFGPRLSGDGRWLALTSTADLEPGACGCASDRSAARRSTRVHLRDNQRQTTTCIGAKLHEDAPRGRSYAPSLSADGRYVAFVFDTASITAPKGDGPQVHLHDIERSSTIPVSRTPRGGTPDAGSWRPAVSADGRFVVFESLASNLVCRRRCAEGDADLNLLPDVYLFDVQSGERRRLSVGGEHGEWWAPSVAPAIDGSGGVVAFSSRQPRDVEDVDTGFDLYVWTRGESDQK